MLQWLQDADRPLDWNGPASRTFTRFRDQDLDRSIIAHFERVARRHPSRIAVTDSETSLSYSELWDGLSALAEFISAETKSGDLIGIALPTCAKFPLAILACLAAGRPFVALDPDYPDSWLAQVLDDARPALILRRETFAVPGPATRGWRPAPFDVDQPACVLFTSGSTGRPKGIVNSQRNILQRVAQSINAAHINPDDRLLTLASCCTIVGVRDAITALLAGASIHLLDPQRAGAREILSVIHAQSITILFAFPALLRSVIADAENRADNNLRLVRIGGDLTLWSDIDRLRAWLAPKSAIQLIYAATEAPMMQWFVDDRFRTDDPRIPIGYPLPGNHLALIDEHGHNTPPGEVGELIVESQYVSLGLWREGQYIPPSSSSRVFHTGDLVRQRPDGLLERMGRKNRQVKVRGSRVDLEGVEAALRQHPLVSDAAVLARTNTDHTFVTLIAYVCARDGEPAGLLDDIREFMRSAPSPMRPARYYVTTKIPRLPSSKLDESALLALDEINIRADIVTETEVNLVFDDSIAQSVAKAWHEVLNTPVRSADDDFFEVGGDSLKAIALTTKVERALNLELPFTLINESPKFDGFCRVLREHRTNHYVPLVALKTGEDLPPVFFIHGLGGNVAELFPMTRRMTYPGPVIGIQARGLTGKEPPHASVEAMAVEYLKAVKARQPEGPYFLCGYSFGGLVAFEMARRLKEAGDEVGLVGLFDTRMSPIRWPLRVWFSIARRRVLQFASRISRDPLHIWPAALRRISARAPASRKQDGPPLPAFLKSAPTSVLRVAASALVASARYRPGFYPEELTLFSPAAGEPCLPSLQSIWRKHSRALSVVNPAGDHWTMLAAPNAESTAACLTQRILLSSGRNREASS